MTGTRIPSNAAPLDSTITAASNRRAPTYYAPSGQSLYSDLWQDMRNYLDTYCNMTRTPPLAPLTSTSSLADFSPSPSTQSNLSNQSYAFPRDIDSIVNFANLENAGGIANPHNLDDSSTIASTIQFDSGSNPLSGSSQQSNLTNFSSPYDYSDTVPISSSPTANQTRFNDSSMTSTLWNVGSSFACLSSSRGKLSDTNLDNVSTVDYTGRWEVGSNNLSSSPAHHSSLSNNLQPTIQPFVKARLRPYVCEPSVAVSQRIDRALEHRLYMIDRQLVGDPQAPAACDYQVLGATGNVYTVRLATIPSCTCPDPQRPCKHLLFIMLRFLKLSSEDYRIWQTALTTNEVTELICQTRLDPDVLASQQARQRFQEISNQVLDGGDSLQLPLQREVSGDCPVCFEVLSNNNGSAKEELSFCRACGNNVHKDCFQRWSRKKQESGEKVNCIFCRSIWFDESIPKKRKAESEVGADDFVNLADYSSHHRAEDLSLENLYPNVRAKYLREWRES